MKLTGYDHWKTTDERDRDEQPPDPCKECGAESVCPPSCPTQTCSGCLEVGGVCDRCDAIEESTR